MSNQNETTLPKGVLRGVLFGKTREQALATIGKTTKFKEISVTRYKGYVMIDIYYWWE